MEESSAMMKRRVFFDHIDTQLMVTTKERKEILLNNETFLIYHGNSYTIKFKNLGGGVWSMYTERKLPEQKNQLK